MTQVTEFVLTASFISSGRATSLLGTNRTNWANPMMSVARSHPDIAIDQSGRDATYRRVGHQREAAGKHVKLPLVVAMGATAAQSVLGKVTPINKTRGSLIDHGEEAQVLVTVHPSYLLRLPDQDARAREYHRFVDDLKVVAAHLKETEAA